jgi:hypothetical protein
VVAVIAADQRPEAVSTAPEAARLAHAALRQSPVSVMLALFQHG